MGSASDITTLFPQDGEAEMGFRQGVVLSFDPVTGENTIIVGGTVLTDVPILNMSGATLLLAGDVVGLLRSQTTYFIVGRIVTPGEGQLGTRLAVAYAAEVDTQVNLATVDTWLDLTNSEGPIVPNVPIGNASRAIVFARAEIQNDSFAQGWMGFEISGATIRSPLLGDAVSFRSHNVANTAGISAASLALVENLTPGLHTFTAKYRTSNGDSFFSFRRLVVLPY